MVAAVTQQLAMLNTNSRYLSEGLVAHAEALVETFPEELEVTYMKDLILQ